MGFACRVGDAPRRVNAFTNYGVWNGVAYPLKTCDLSTVDFYNPSLNTHDLSGTLHWQLHCLVILNKFKNGLPRLCSPVSLALRDSLIYTSLPSERGEKNYAVAFINLFWDQLTDSTIFYHLLITTSTLLDALDLFQCPNAALAH